MDFKTPDRRNFLQLLGLGLGGVVFGSGLMGVAGCASSRKKPDGADDFYFLQLSDTHWGFKGPPNPEADVTLKNTVSLVNALQRQPDFIVFTGDLPHTTDHGDERRKRLGEFGQIVKRLNVKSLRFLAGGSDPRPDPRAVQPELVLECQLNFHHTRHHV